MRQFGPRLVSKEHTVEKTDSGASGGFNGGVEVGLAQNSTVNGPLGFKALVYGIFTYDPTVRTSHVEFVNRSAVMPVPARTPGPPRITPLYRPPFSDCPRVPRLVAKMGCGGGWLVSSRRQYPTGLRASTVVW